MPLKMERMPGDLLACILLALSMLVFTLTSLANLPVRIPLGLAMVLFVPGYAFIAALFPRRSDLEGQERAALSFCLSIAIVPLLGLGLNFTPWGIRLPPVALSLAGFTIAITAIAYLRRMEIPVEERFSIQFANSMGSLRQSLSADTKGSRVLTVILITAIIISISALAYVVVTPKQEEKFTEFYILGLGGKAYDYPTEVLAGDNSTVIVSVINHEYAPANYTMNITLNNSPILDKALTLQHNQTWEEPVSYVLAKPADQQKLEFLLFKDGNFTMPYRDLHLWVNVSGR